MSQVAAVCLRVWGITPASPARLLGDLLLAPLEVVTKNVGYEDLRGITWAVSPPSSLQPFCEDCFSLFAVCRTSRALAAPTVFGPADVEGRTIAVPFKPWTLVASWHRSKRLSDGTPYFEWDHEEVGSRIEDTGHAGFALASLAVLLEDQIALNALLARAGRPERVALSTPLFVRFANTFLRKIWVYDFQNPNGPRNLLAGCVDGSEHPTEKKNANSECAGWVPLAQFDRWVWIRCRDATFHPPEYLQEDNHAALLRYRQFLHSRPQ
jgi:hypothetical protein